MDYSKVLSSLLLVSLLFVTSAYSISVPTKSATGDPSPPVWPFQFNSTLVKIAPHNDTIQWTKLYYDWTNNRSRFDFYTHYWTSYSDATPPIYYVIYFINTTIWFEYPLDNICYIRATDIPSVDPYWVDNFNFVGDVTFRGLPAEHWRWPKQPYLQYFNLAAEPRLPMRSTNQINDLGATDYYDVMVGPQDEDVFQLSPLCQKAAVTHPLYTAHSSKEERLKWRILGGAEWPGWP